MIPSIEVFYIHSPENEFGHRDCELYVHSYLKHTPSIKHDHTIVWNDLSGDLRPLKYIHLLPNAVIVPHDNTGWDIGAYISLSRLSKAEIVVCFGSNIHFFTDGWMERMVDVWMKYGPGLYGVSASFEISPHINTTGFWCSPGMLRDYPYPIVSKEDRYNFEHGHSNRSLGIMGVDRNVNMTFWKRIHSAGFPVKMVTWDGEWDWWDWRKPVNIFRRGNQSNMLLHWKHSDGWMSSSDDQKRLSSVSTDLITDPCFNLSKRSYESRDTCKTPALFNNPYKFYMDYMKRHNML